MDQKQNFNLLKTLDTVIKTCVFGKDKDAHDELWDNTATISSGGLTIEFRVVEPKKVCYVSATTKTMADKEITDPWVIQVDYRITDENKSLMPVFVQFKNTAIETARELALLVRSLVKSYEDSTHKPCKSLLETINNNVKLLAETTNPVLTHKCEFCGHRFEISYMTSEFKDHKLLWNPRPAKNMVYDPEMNRHYAFCRKCGQMENHFSAEVRDNHTTSQA